MVNKRIERLEVLEPCMRLCRELKIQGYILRWKRLDALDRYHESGEPDLEIWFSKDRNIWILMAECKKPLGGVLSPRQIKYRNKFKKFNNTIYIEVINPEQIRQMVISMSDFRNEEFDEFMESGIQ